VLGVVGFDRRLEDANAVITGEGRLDAQSREGKLIGEIARRCRAARVPAYAIAGEVVADEIARLGFASVEEAGSPEAIEDAAERIAAFARG
jgi:glycerate kinase